VSREEYMGKDEKFMTRRTDYLFTQNSLTAQKLMLDDSTILTTRDSFDYISHSIIESHYFGHDFHGNTVYSLDSNNRIARMEISHPGSVGKELHKFYYDERGLLLTDSTFLPNKTNPEVRTYEYEFY
jgi:hypothetical protein